jgi:hypothetical protein
VNKRKNVTTYLAASFGNHLTMVSLKNFDRVTKKKEINEITIEIDKKVLTSILKDLVMWSILEMEYIFQTRHITGDSDDKKNDKN